MNSLIIIGKKKLNTKNKLIAFNPATGKRLGTAACARKSEVERAVQSARETFQTWSKVDVTERCETIRRAASLLEKCAKEFAETITKEMGKPIFESEGEVTEAISEMRWFADNVSKFIESERYENSEVIFESIGVVAVITPWNFPLDTPIWKIIPAILTGNTVVYKPSSITPHTAFLFVRLMHEAGLPAGALNLVTGDDETGKLLVESDVDAISLTGGTETGKKVMAVAAKSLKKVLLELGGSDPAIVCRDADLDLTVEGVAWSAFANTGQVCNATKRIFVEKEIADKFISKLVEKVKSLKVGNPLDTAIDIGPLASKGQLAALEAQVADAVKHGAKILCGGKRRGKGFFFEPTLLLNVNSEMEVLREEVFGPVRPIVIVKNVGEAIRLANEIKYGLGATVWTQDLEKAKQIAKQLEAGLVWINELGLPNPNLPWSGVKQSGLGCELSKHGVLEFVNKKQVSVYRAKAKRDWWFPYKK